MMKRLLTVGIVLAAGLLGTLGASAQTTTSTTPSTTVFVDRLEPPPVSTTVFVDRGPTRAEATTARLGLTG